MTLLTTQIMFILASLKCNIVLQRVLPQVMVLVLLQPLLRQDPPTTLLFGDFTFQSPICYAEEKARQDTRGPQQRRHQGEPHLPRVAEQVDLAAAVQQRPQWWQVTASASKYKLLKTMGSLLRALKVMMIILDIEKCSAWSVPIKMGPSLGFREAPPDLKASQINTEIQTTHLQLL